MSKKEKLTRALTHNAINESRHALDAIFLKAHFLAGLQLKCTDTSNNPL